MNKDIYIYKPIGKRTQDNWGEVKSAEDVATDLLYIEGDEIIVHVNCPGGSITEGMAIFNILNACGKRVIMKIEGMAASMASIVILAGNEIVISEFARIMTHRIHGESCGSADDMRRDANSIEALEQKFLEIYSSRTGLTQDECKTKFMTDTDVWFSAEEAVAAKLADRIEKGTLTVNLTPGESNAQAFYQSCAALLKVPNQSKDMDFLKLKNQLQLSEDVTEDAFLAQVAGWRTQAQQVESMTAELQGFKDAASQAEISRITALIDKAVNEKRILPTQKEMWNSLFQANALHAETALMSIAPAKDLTNIGGDTTERDTLSAMSWDQLDKGHKLEHVRAAYFDLYEAKFEEKFGKKV